MTPSYDPSHERKQALLTSGEFYTDNELQAVLALFSMLAPVLQYILHCLFLLFHIALLHSQYFL